MPRLGGQKSCVLIPKRQGTPLPQQLDRDVLGQKVLLAKMATREAWPWVFEGHPFGLGHNSKCGCSGAPAKGKARGRKEREEGSSQES